MVKPTRPAPPPPPPLSRSARLATVGFVDLGYGTAIRVGDVSSYHPAILDWRDPVSRYDIPGKGKASRTVVVNAHGLKLPCVHGWQLLQKLIHNASTKYRTEDHA